MKRILFLCTVVAFCWTAAASAQTYDLQFVPNVRKDTLVLRVQMRLQSGESPLGSANLKFSYNASVLSFPEFPVRGVDYRFFAFDSTDADSDYRPATTTRPVVGSASLNITNIMENPGTNVGTSFVDVAEVYLHIDDPDAAPDFTWDAENTFCFGAGTFAIWEPGNLTTASDVSLPVELVSFSAQANGPAVQLTWTTASETNNAGFDVEYAIADSARFVSAGFVDGHGTTSETQAYSFHFNPGQVGTYRVRLKQIDFDGAFSYGPETEVTINLLADANGQPVAYTLSEVAPNPFRTTATLTFQTVTGQQVQAQLYNALGQRIRTLFDGYAPSGSTRRFTIDGARLSPGLYVLQVKGEHFSETRQLVLVR